jgi:hypothetical protein
MPRRYQNYLPPFQAWHVAASVAATIGVVALWLALRDTRRTPDDTVAVFD